MPRMIKRWALTASVMGLASALALLGACGKEKTTTATVSTTATVPPPSTPAVPAPAGDSTPKPADTMAAPAVQQNEKTGANAASAPATVGTAASGAPPYSLNAAPEGNPTPSQGSAPGKTDKK